MRTNYRLSLNIKGRLYEWQRPLVMGVLNLTPDSFYSGSRVNTVDAVLKRAERMLDDGADILDFGAQSTRPGSDFVNEIEEIKRLEEPLKKVIEKFPEALISIDTFNSKVSDFCLNIGAHIINDISAGNIDEENMNVCAKYNAPFIAMHMQGEPKNMQDNPTYNDVCVEVSQQLSEKILEAEKSGIKDIILDFGFGFGKTIEHNYELMRNMAAMKNILQKPILVGISRKSMIWRTLNITPEEALPTTSALNLFALQHGADIIRVHDVREAVQVRKLWVEYLN